MVVADFETDLAFSNSPEVEAFWERQYRQFWPGYVFSLINANDNIAQRRGVDRLVYIGVDKFIRTDEKNDTYPPKNFFMEFLSCDKSGAPAWLEKELSADYFAYGFINYNVCHMLPVASTCYAWRKYGEVWKQRYRVREVYNHGYKTLGVPVPIPVVWNAIAEGLYIQGAGA